MPKKRPQATDQILGVISRHPEGISRDALHEALAGTISKRSLQRRLSELVSDRRLTSIGKARAMRYKLTPGAGERHAVLPALELVAQGEAYVPISPEGEEIRSYVRQPVQQRKPVGYNRDFLESYRANKTFYLTPEIRAHLHRIGHSQMANRPAGTYAREIMNRLLIDLSWASSRLEGNTYTRLDTQNLIELGQAAEGKDQQDAQMILNHKAAIELLIEHAEDIGFNTFTFFNLHALLSENLLRNPNDSGRIREIIVDIGGTVFHPLGIPQQIDQYFRLILEKTGAIADPFEQAFFIMVQIPYLQPFVDVNKRVSRLGANISLIRHNLCPLSFVDVPERAYVEGTLGVYELIRIELLRDVFVWAYERSCQRYLAVKETIAQPDPLRLRYREALIEVVGNIVRGMQPPSEQAVRVATKDLVPPEDVDRFVALAMHDVSNLHEGNISRYRLRLSDYRAWKQAPEHSRP